MSDMESRLRQRLAELRAEYDKGQQTLHELDSQAASVRATLLRISGAVQVLAEALGEVPAEAAPAGAVAPGQPHLVALPRPPAAPGGPAG